MTRLQRLETKYEPKQWRAQAAELWDEWRSVATTPPKPMAGFWSDRLGFRLSVEHGSKAAVTPQGIAPFAQRGHNYEATLMRWAKGTPGVPGYPPESWHAPLGDLPLAQDMLKTFRLLLARFGLEEYGETFILAADQTWVDFFSESVFFPATPAFNGASFLSRFTPQHSERLIAEAGSRGPLEFAVALTAVHERLHTLQTGDSLFCEFIVSVLWSALLTELDMWHWQIDPTTGRSSHREHTYLRGLELDERAVGECVRDAAVGVRGLMADPNWYGAFCAGGWLFDAGDWRYDDYMAFVSSALKDPLAEAPESLERGRSSPRSAGRPHRAERRQAKATELRKSTGALQVGKARMALGTRSMWGWRTGPLISVFRRHSAPVAVIGGVAGSYYSGGSIHPLDLDVVYASSAEAVGTVYMAVLEILEKHPVDNPPDVISLATFEQGHPFVMESRGTRLELIGSRVGDLRDEVVDRRHWVLLDRSWTPICQLADLVALKMRDRRPKDVEHLRLLQSGGRI